MIEKYFKNIALELSISEKQIANTYNLLSEGCTIPFISRYRKEATGSLTDVQVADVAERIEYYDKLEQRKNTILKSIKEQEKLTPELEAKIIQTVSLTELEDIYLPYKPKKRTRASIAKEKGLEPLAKEIFAQKNNNIYSILSNYINDKVANEEEAIQGAQDIIAEWISETKETRELLRNDFKEYGQMSSSMVKGKEEEGEKYRDYFKFNEPLNKCAPHRLLAILRGEREGILKIGVDVNEEITLKKLYRQHLSGYNKCSDIVKPAIEDSYKRLLKPSIEKEALKEAKERADEESINVFADNLEQLLMAPPLGSVRTLALDPGFRTGCKVVCLDEKGDILHNETIYPHPPQSDTKKAMSKVSQLVETYNLEAIAIGNGTASRETEHFIKRIAFKTDVKVFIVNESGASIYSASKTGREEFPSYDVTVRGAISIGRRLMDPLAELVKIDPKSIGVGQYQHDVDQTKLQKSLTQIVENCVNNVGVELNTASKHILTYISGLGPQLAQNIVDYRKENGSFKSRKELLKVARMGKKAYEQCAGFLRIRGAKNPLDNSAVHPESYHIVEKMAKDKSLTVQELLANKAVQGSISLEQYTTDTVGLPTLQDISKELAKPGRDPREGVKIFSFDESLRTIADVQPGIVVPGIVTNITNFGAFVDIGIKENGLVHISNITNEFITNVSEHIKLNQHVQVKVIEVDHDRKRIQLSMKDV